MVLNMMNLHVENLFKVQNWLVSFFLLIQLYKVTQETKTHVTEIYSTIKFLKQLCYSIFLHMVKYLVNTVLQEILKQLGTQQSRVNSLLKLELLADNLVAYICMCIHVPYGYGVSFNNVQ